MTQDSTKTRIDSKINNYQIGIQGQNTVENRFKDLNYCIYVKNFKKIGFELDLIVYKYMEDKNILVIRIIEVKTRSSANNVDLSKLGLEKKWIKVKKIMFTIVDDIKILINRPCLKHKVSFDLAIVHSAGLSTYSIKEYIEDVNLLL